MSKSSVAHRVRQMSMRISVIIAIFAFAILGGGDLFDQWIAGSASPTFMLGTLLINAGLSLGAFAIIAGIGWGLSISLAARSPDNSLRAGVASGRTALSSHSFDLP